MQDHRRPAIRVNQVGYPARAAKHATLVDDGAEPRRAELRRADGSVAWHGRTDAWPVRPEPTSGLPVHSVDFSAVTETGSGYRLTSGDLVSHPFRIADDVYDQLARDALHVFHLLRSGVPIPASAAGAVHARPGGHLGVPPNTGDTAVREWRGPEADALYPGWDRTGRVFDVSGGWYDAGDYGKYVVSGSVALWQLLRLVELVRTRPDPRAVVDESALVEECRWQLDWLLRMQVPPGHDHAGLVFHRVHGTTWSPVPGLPHLDPTLRVLHRPSTAATLHLAAVSAYAARLLQAGDPGYAQRLLSAATTAFDAARRHPALIAPDDEGRFGGGPYGDDRLEDDLYWAAAELWLTTGAESMREAVLDSPCHRAEVFDTGGFDFDDVAPLARLDLCSDRRRLPDHAEQVLSLRRAAERLVELRDRQPFGQPYAPADGWSWGSNGRLLNNAVVLTAAFELAGEPRYHRAASGSLDHVLGRNALGNCYVTGFGTDRTSHLRARPFGRDLDPALPPAPPGALAGGPNSRPTPGWPTDPRLRERAPQCAYLDEPTSETTNDLCVRWNAPLAYVAAWASLTPAP